MTSSVLVHFGLCVSDLERAQRFYTEAFGYVHDRSLEMPAAKLQALMQLDPPSDIRAVYLMLGGQTLELMTFNPPPPKTANERAFNHTGLTHLSIAVEDVAETCAKAQALGGAVLTQFGRAAVLRDPDGQLIEIVQLVVNEEIERGRAERAATRR